MMSYLKRITLIAAAGTSLTLLSRPAEAQLTGVLNYWQPATGNWNVPSNWSLGTLPDGQTTDDFAVIGGVSGSLGISTGAATIDSAITNMPGGITLGAAAGNSGTLQISSGGSITVATTAFDGNGNVYVGVGGTGTLNIDRGGSLTTAGLNSSGSGSSLVRLGSTTGSGSAVVVVSGDANLARMTQVVGPNVDFTSSNLILSGTLVEQITSTTQSALKATTKATLGGTLSVSIDPSITPAVGQSWNLINAQQVTGAFSTVSITSAPSLGLGQSYNVRTQPGGLGNLVQLDVEQQLVLNVDRGSHQVSILNPGTSGISIDGYSVQSTSLNALNPLNLTPLGGTWQTANATTSHVNQLNPTGSSTLAGGSSTALGAIFSPPTPVAFGTSTEDLAFRYTQPDGSIRTAAVNYTGSTGINNLVLRVDPATGAAQLRNTSNFSENIDAYTISSAMGSLSTSLWNSLDDQNAAGGDWQEANISTNRLSELKFAGATTLASNQFYNVGNPFNLAVGKRDLTFQYLLQGDSTARTGVVVYESIPMTLTGDYNGNGVVDAADYVMWRNNPTAFGGSSGYNTWRANFGNHLGSGSSGALGAQAVPEPNSLASIVFALGIVFAMFFQPRSSRLDRALCLVFRK